MFKLWSLCGRFRIQTQDLGRSQCIFHYTAVAAMLVLIASMAANPTLFFKIFISLFQKCPFLIGEIDIVILLVGKSLRQSKVIVFH